MLLYLDTETTGTGPDDRLCQIPDAVALDLDKRYRGWKLGLTGPIAIVPAESFELVDGLIVY